MDYRPRIFICYSHVDKERVDENERQIREAGINYFRDTRDPKFGKNLMEQVREEIGKATHVLAHIPAGGHLTDWVLCEIGMAWALRRHLVGYPADPSASVPEVMKPLRWIISQTDFQEWLSHLQKYDEISQSMTKVEKESKEKLYYHPGSPGGYASAIRLFGGGDEFASLERVNVHYEHITLPETALSRMSHDVIEEHRAETVARNGMFFNGPNCRLLRWAATAKDGPRVALERNIVDLYLGPVGWYDYVGLNGALRKLYAPNPPDVPEYNFYIGLKSLINDNDVSKSLLSNILDTATTVVSSDGCVGYVQRGSQVSSQHGKKTSAVAENINRYYDECRPGTAELLHPPSADEPDAGVNLDNSYQPKGIPHPFATVKRGIADELSGSLIPHLRDRSIKLIGLSFDLHSLHPDLLFAVFIPLSAEEIMTMYRTDPGKERREGLQLHFVPAQATSRDTELALEVGAGAEWVPGGKASIIATMQLISTIRASRGWTFQQAFQFLIDAV